MAKHPERKRKRFFARLVRHYRLVIVNDDTLKTEASLKLNLLNVILIGSSLFVVFAGLILSLLLFTPLKERIPGYEYTYLHRQKLADYKRLTDSLLHQVETDRQYYANILSILKDSLPHPSTDRPAPPASAPAIPAPPHDSMLRQEMEQRAGYSILTGHERRASGTLDELHFFCPLKGPVIERFDPSKNHFGVDIVAAENSPIKATLDGKVLYAGWSGTDGYFIIIQHTNNLSSVYKHNSALLKRTGDMVRAGDVIAIIGDTGDYSHGLHMHFELWHNMAAVDPMLFIRFD